MEDIKESLDNVSEVEEKSKEVVDPAFAAAVRSIKDNDEKRDEAVELMDAPKEGEETLSKDLKFTLDESLFEEYQEAEVLHLYVLRLPGWPVRLRAAVPRELRPAQGRYRLRV